MQFKAYLVVIDCTTWCTIRSKHIVVIARKANLMKVSACVGTTVSRLAPVEGLQCLRVEVAPHGEIPLHRHDCAATTIVIAGTARKLLASGSPGRMVRAGEVVVKQPRELHGFVDIGPEGFKFISLSSGEGIVKGESTWDIEFA